ncbi:MAG: calcium-binding protein [Gomphosphaeria aponina SAG 52.96 = DSM 107014]|uniref:Calcium-binding protein n=1 Tax=Gomphosphaeria aponina SAG 52.96 = DSM 107014 TaxID=1521640 RepID=A0A941JSR4_9CHRO|nr:calcium-binding protein [Gomphosphaeria aponina SAG 52.96 = DSM 107014]
MNGTGNSNPNILTGNGKNNRLDGGAGNDQLRGASGADVLIGGTGNDNLNGGAGADNMSGGKGNDVYTVDNIADVVTELVNEGNDIVNSLLAEYTLADNLERLTLGGVGNINGNGNNLSNLITGNSGDNILRGGAGADIFSFVGPTHGVDNILDFSGGDGEGDRIRVNSINFGGGLVKGRLKSDQFVIDTEATEAEHRFIYDNSLGRLFYDADGLGGNTQVHLATLTGNPELVASDIFIF